MWVQLRIFVIADLLLTRKNNNIMKEVLQVTNSFRVLNNSFV